MLRHHSLSQGCRLATRFRKSYKSLHVNLFLNFDVLSITFKFTSRLGNTFYPCPPTACARLVPPCAPAAPPANAPLGPPLTSPIAPPFGKTNLVCSWSVSTSLQPSYLPPIPPAGTATTPVAKPAAARPCPATSVSHCGLAKAQAMRAKITKTNNFILN